MIKGRGTNVNKRFQMWRVRSLTCFHLGRRGSPRGFWLVRATPRWSLLREAVLVNVPERFLSQIKATFACLFRKRTLQIDSCYAHLNFGLSFYSVTQPLRISVSSKQNSKPLCSKFLALQRLKEVVAAIKQASGVSKQHQSRHCGVSRTEKCMQADKSAETF